MKVHHVLIAGFLLLFRMYPGVHAQGMETGLTLMCSQNLSFLVVDPSNRCTGTDPFSGDDVEDIPNSSYGLQSIGSWNSDTEINSMEFTCNNAMGDSLLNGNYVIDVTAQESGPFVVDMFVIRGAKHDVMNVKGFLQKGARRTFSLFYTSDTTVALRLDTIYAERVVSVGINGSPGAVSIMARSVRIYGSKDTLRCTTATLRWPAALGVSLGSVTSGYGFTKVDTAVIIGAYRYQKFQTTQKTALNWQAGTDYELFRVAVRDTAGIGVFELTNALPGGEWFVDINYLDKTDPVFLPARKARR